MKKIILVCASMFLISAVFAQKVKLKKELFSIDGVDAGYVYDYKNLATGDDGYIYTSMDKRDTLFVIRRDYNEGMFFDISASFDDKKSEIDYDKIVFSLKDVSIVTNILVQNYRFFTDNGLDKGRVLNYLNAPRITRPELLRRLREEPRSRVAVEDDLSKAGSENDLSRTDIEGILTFKDDKKLEGTFRVYFRQTDDGRVKLEKEQFTISFNNPKKGVTYLYTDDKGMDKKKIYSASDLRSLEVKRADGNSEIYDVLERNNIVSVISIQSDGSINPKGTGTGTSKEFALRVEITPTMSLHYKDGTYFITKTGQQSMPILANQVKEQLLILSEKCSDITTKVDNNEYADYTRAKLIRYVLDYNSCANNPFK